MIHRITLTILLSIIFIPHDSHADGGCSGELNSGHAHWSETEIGAIASCEAVGGGVGSCFDHPPIGGYICNTAGANSNRTNWFAWTGIACEAPNVTDPETGLCVLPECDGINVDGVCYLNPLDDSCSNPLGTIQGIEICDDAKQDCEDTGGTYGFINGIETCLTDPNVLVCEAGTFTWVNLNGDFVCATPDNELETEEPQVCEDDYDCDGILDINDTDANGDGILDVDTDGDLIFNFIDDDDDNDGVLDINDLDQDGDGLGDCDPTSKDYAECIREVEKIDPTLDDAIEGQGNLDASLGIGKFNTAALTALGDGTTNQAAPTAIVSMFDSIFTLGSCAPLILDIQGNVLTVTCDDMAPLRAVLAFVVAFWTLLYCFEIVTATSTVRSKA